MAGGLTLLTGTDASIPTPAAGKVTVYYSTDQNAPCYKDSLGVVHLLTGAAGTTGAQGPIGPVLLGSDGEQGEMGFPGPAGAAGGGGGGTQVLFSATLDLSNSNLDNGNSTPLDLIAAPGANKVIIVVSALFYCNVSVSKGANPSQRLRWTGDTTPVVDFAVGPGPINMPLNSTGENWRYVLSNVSSAATPSAANAWANTTFDPRNKAVQWSMSANTAIGTGTAKIRATYYVADLS